MMGVEATKAAKKSGQKKNVSIDESPVSNDQDKYGQVS